MSTAERTRTTAADPGAPPEDLRYARQVLSVVSLASILFALGTSSLTVALPAVVRHFDASPAAASWMLLSFMLTTTTLMVTMGRLADLYGRRTLYLAGMAVYTVTGLLLGLAPGPWWVVGLRVAQAAGGAMLLTNGAALLGDAYPRDRLGRPMGVYIASFSVAQLVGPTLGGLLAQAAGWRWVFWCHVPLGVVCLVWGLLVLRRPAPPEHRPGFDVPGNLLLVAGTGGLLYALAEASESGWDAPPVLVGFAAAAVLLPLFVIAERRARHPVVDLALFRDRVFGWGLAASFGNAVARFAVIVLLGLWFQAVHGRAPVEAALAVLPMPLATMLASASSGRLQDRCSSAGVAVVGAIVTAAGLVALVAVLDAGTGYPAVAAALVVVGLGSGLFMPANTVTLLHDVPSDRLGVVNGVRMGGTNAGVMLSTALALPLVVAPVPEALRGLVFAGTLGAQAPEAVDRLVLGYRLALGVMAVVALLAAVAAVRARAATRARGAALSPPAPAPARPARRARRRTGTGA